ncbi:MAG: flagellar hook-length control protein FliK [Lachnospiraceae bacterium]|nr:flagellar hook-length control protein FliK [Lachnospiraceae bacterium]
MTSAIVTQPGGLLSQTMIAPGNTESPKSDFADVFQAATDKSDSQSRSEAVSSGSVPSTRVQTDVSERVEQPVEQEEVNAVEEVANAEEVIEETVKQLKEEISKELNVTEEEILQAMENLGLTDASLLTKEGMTDLVMELTGISSSVELLTNGEIYASLQNLLQVSETMKVELQQDFRITEEQLKELLTQLENSNLSEQPETLNVDVESTEETSTETKQSEVTTEVGQETETETQPVKTEVIQENGNMSGQENGTTSDNGANAGTEASVQVNTITEAASVNETATAFDSLAGTGEPSTQEIMNQITEYIKVNAKANVTEMEMQLNPESLGKIQIHLTAKEGAVSAQFIAQNDVVKAAIESQMIQLKESFEQQGIKVNAVEVTVSSHSFDQNMQNDNHEQTGDAKASKKMIIRRLNLNEELVEEELSEDEKLAADMMAANGNTVDFMA